MVSTLCAIIPSYYLCSIKKFMNDIDVSLYVLEFGTRVILAYVRMMSKNTIKYCISTK